MNGWLALVSVLAIAAVAWASWDMTPRRGG